MNCYEFCVFYGFNCLGYLGLRDCLLGRFAFFPPRGATYIFRDPEQPQLESVFNTEGSLQQNISQNQETSDISSVDSQMNRQSFEEIDSMRFHRISSVITEKDVRVYSVPLSYSRTQDEESKKADKSDGKEKLSELSISVKIKSSQIKQIKQVVQPIPLPNLQIVREFLRRSKYSKPLDVKLISRRQKKAINLNIPDDVCLQGYYLLTKKGDTIPCVLLQQAKTRSDYILIHSHGNSSDIGVLLDSYLDLNYNLGVNVLGYDYPGYGQASGEAGDRQIISAAERVYEFVTKELDFSWEKIIVYGQSVGTGPSVMLASRVEYPIGGLILHSGFRSGLSVMVPNQPYISYLDMFPNIEYIKYVNCLVLIIHGSEDSMVAPKQFKDHSQSEDLANQTKNLFKLWLVKDAGHNNIEMEEQFRKDYFQTLRGFLREIFSHNQFYKQEELYKLYKATRWSENMNHLYIRDKSFSSVTIQY